MTRRVRPITQRATEEPLWRQVDPSTCRAALLTFHTSRPETRGLGRPVSHWIDRGDGVVDTGGPRPDTRPEGETTGALEALLSPARSASTRPLLHAPRSTRGPPWRRTYESPRSLVSLGAWHASGSGLRLRRRRRPPPQFPMRTAERPPGREEPAHNASRRSSGVDERAETRPPTTPSPLTTEDLFSAGRPAKDEPVIRGRGAILRVPERPARDGRGRWPLCALGRERPSPRRELGAATMWSALSLECL